MRSADFFGGGVGTHAARIDDDRTLSVVLRLGQVVSGEKDRLTFRGLGTHEIPELLAHGDVHSGGRFVKNDEFWVRN